MNCNANSRKNAAKLERQQRKVDAGLLKAQFPGVAGIVISMMYSKRGMNTSPRRVINVFPDSYALFRVECLNRDCVDGGIDLTQVINSMIRNRRESSTGNISCDGNCISAGHAAIEYEVAIRYA